MMVRLTQSLRPGNGRAMDNASVPSTLSGTIMSVVVIAVVALLLGARIIWRRGDRRRAVLMIAAALVLAGNIAIWSLPPR